MTDEHKSELLDNAVAGIEAIKAQFNVEVIKDYEIPPLVNTATGEYFVVKLRLNTSYDYDEEMLTEWKRLLKADDWYIGVKRNQLHVTFFTRCKEEGDRHDFDDDTKLTHPIDGNEKEQKGEKIVSGMWNSVNDRLPEHGQRVLCVDVEGQWWDSVFRRQTEGMSTAGFMNIQYGMICDVYHIPFVTHWISVVVPDKTERKAVFANMTENQRQINSGVMIKIKE